MKIHPQDHVGGIPHHPTPITHNDLGGQKIDMLLDMGVISLSHHERGQVISPIFPREKADDKYRTILDLKKLNETINIIHLKHTEKYSEPL